MTLEYIIKQAFSLGYFQGMDDAKHGADEYSDGQAATLGYFSTELGVESFADWDVRDWQKLRWKERNARLKRGE